jgi:hypothetical protein
LIRSKKQSRSSKLIVVSKVTITVHKTIFDHSSSLANLVGDRVLDGTSNLAGNTLSGSLSLLGHTLRVDIVTLDLYGNLVGTVLEDESRQILDSARTSVLDGLSLGVGAVKLDGGETLNLIGNVVGSGIDLGDGDLARVGLVQFTELLVLGSKRLAVAAPGSVELNQNILVGVHDNLIVVLGNNNSDGTVLLLGNGLTLDARLDLASDKVIEELGNLLGGKVRALKGELLVLLRVLDGKGGPLADLEVEVAGVLTKVLCVDGSKVDLALVLLGDRLERSGESLALLGCLGEDVG